MGHLVRVWFGTAGASLCLAALAAAGLPAPTTTEFKVAHQGGALLVEVRTVDPPVRIPVDRGWLTSDEDAVAEQEAYVSSLEFDETVTSFEVGNGLRGLHLSSYAIAPGGSAQGAAGRDVFLTYDPRSGSLGPGLELGITRSRVRVFGCFHAVDTELLLADVNRDRLTDVGVRREEIRCESDLETTVEGPFYEQFPIRWYVFGGDRWRYDPSHDTKLPRGFLRLSPPGLAKGPVDYVKELLSGRR